MQQLGEGFPEADPNAPHVEMVMMECRTCHERSDWASSEDAPSDWQLAHSEESGRKHRSFYVWRITRNTSRQFWI